MPLNLKVKPSIAMKRRFCNEACAVRFRHKKRQDAGLPAPSGWTRDAGPRPFMKERALARYASNPRLCKGCGAVVPLPEGGVPSDLGNKFYCSRECSIKAAREYRLWDLSNLPKSLKVSTVPFMQKGQTSIQELRKHAKRVYRSYWPDQRCEYCNVELPYLPDVAHIKPVSSFSNDSLLLEINQLSNLIGLCPTHHRNFDFGVIPLEEIKEKVATRKPRLSS